MPPSASAGPNQLRRVLAEYRSGFVTVAIVSAILNLLLLGGSIYMMLVYDMVLPSRSGTTLFGLFALVALVYAFQGLLEVQRARILAQIGGAFSHDLAARVYDCVLRLAVPGGSGDRTRPLRDLDTIRTFLSGSGPAALIDAPWVLFFLGVLTLFHPVLGLVTLGGALVMMALTWAADRATRRRSAETQAAAEYQGLLRDQSIVAAESIAAMGMGSRIAARWVPLAGHHVSMQVALQHRVTTLATLSKVFRMFLQSCILTAGALLVIDGQATGGVIFASSILSARALAPVDAAIANWRGLVAARGAWRSLGRMLASVPGPADRVALPAPRNSIACTGLTVTPPGARAPTVLGATFTASAGEVVAIIGASASGKSTLLRGLTGIWPATAGQVRLDGATLDQWLPESLGLHIGHMAQDSILLPGTVAENLSRFHAHADDDQVIAAARAAGIHEMILRMPQGYDTRLEEGGFALSAGQRQRMALARALYGDPFLLLLDEPNSNLDREGEAALAASIRNVRSRGGIVIVVAHRRAILEVVDTVVLMNAGRVQYVGPPDKLQGVTPARAPDPERIDTGPAAERVSRLLAEIRQNRRSA